MGMVSWYWHGFHGMVSWFSCPELGIGILGSQSRVPGVRGTATASAKSGYYTSQRQGTAHSHGLTQGQTMGRSHELSRETLRSRGIRNKFDANTTGTPNKHTMLSSLEGPALHNMAHAMALFKVCISI